MANLRFFSGGWYGCMQTYFDEFCGFCGPIKNCHLFPYNRWSFLEKSKKSTS